MVSQKYLYSTTSLRGVRTQRRQLRGKADAALAVPARRALRVAKCVSQSHTTRHASRPFRMTAGSAAITSIPICREWGGPRILVQMYDI